MACNCNQALNLRCLYHRQQFLECGKSSIPFKVILLTHAELCRGTRWTDRPRCGIKPHSQFTFTPMLSALIPSAQYQAFHLPLLPDLFVSLPHRTTKSALSCIDSKKAFLPCLNFPPSNNIASHLLFQHHRLDFLPGDTLP